MLFLFWDRSVPLHKMYINVLLEFSLLRRAYRPLIKSVVFLDTFI